MDERQAQWSDHMMATVPTLGASAGALGGVVDRMGAESRHGAGVGGACASSPSPWRGYNGAETAFPAATAPSTSGIAALGAAAAGMRLSGSLAPVEAPGGRLTGAGCGVSAFQPLFALDLGREVNSVALSPDGRRAVFALQDHSLQMWELEAQVLVHVFRGHKYWVNHVAYSIDGVHIASASADKTAKVWNVVNGECVATLHGHILSVAGVAFSDDATRLATGSWDKTVCVWDLERPGRPMLVLNGHTDWVHSVAWAPGGRSLASASSDHSVRVWSATSGVVELVLVGHLQTVTSLSFARSGIMLASGSLDRTVRVWNLRDGALVARMQQDGEEGSVHSVAFAPDGERVVAGFSDRCVKVWNIKTNECEARYQGHEEPVLGVAVTPDGNRIVSCARDKVARVWQMPRGQRHAVSPTATGVNAGQYSSSGEAASSFQELHDRLRCTEDANQRLREQLSAAHTQMEEKHRRMMVREASVSEQERQLSDYREMIRALTEEKERLARSFEEMQRELRQLPSSPAGCTAAATPAGAASGALAAMSLGPAGRASSARASASQASNLEPAGSQAGRSHGASKIEHFIDRPAGGSQASVGGGPRYETPPRQSASRAPASPWRGSVPESRRRLQASAQPTSYGEAADASGRWANARQEPWRAQAAPTPLPFSRGPGMSPLRATGMPQGAFHPSQMQHHPPWARMQ
eukprot:TRINITY_DN62727_c0_g1_i1.p1 TRINITY_DN62727_c0_g1~~TRINITY_DN62727_c0_g1_i1.p1  ORF type:complete len:719 (-),score=141.27 TRINITY_DN62727_c0_g1_i1:35-2122(-)